MIKLVAQFSSALCYTIYGGSFDGVTSAIVCIIHQKTLVTMTSIVHNTYRIVRHFVALSFHEFHEKIPFVKI